MFAREQNQASYWIVQAGQNKDLSVKWDFVLLSVLRDILAADINGLMYSGFVKWDFFFVFHFN